MHTVDQSYPITEAATIISDKFFNTDATLGTPPLVVLQDAWRCIRKAFEGL